MKYRGLSPIKEDAYEKRGRPNSFIKLSKEEFVQLSAISKSRTLPYGLVN